MRRASSIVGGILLGIAGLAAVAGTIYAGGAAWTWWDWTYRLGGSLLLVAAGIGNLLPDLALREHAGKLAAARDFLDGAGGELDTAFARSVGSPAYRPGHRTLRMTHVLAALWTERGELERARICFSNLGQTFDADIWAPFDHTYPARAFLAARKRVGL